MLLRLEELSKSEDIRINGHGIKKKYTVVIGNNKGDAILSYEDPFAAHLVGSLYNNA